MAINDEIAAGGRPVQFENPLNNMVKFANIQNDMANMALHKQKMDETQRAQAQAEDTRNFFRTPGLNIENMNPAQKQMLASKNPELFEKLMTQQSTQRTQESETNKRDAETEALHILPYAAEYGRVNNRDEVISLTKHLYANPKLQNAPFHAKTLEQAIAAIPDDTTPEGKAALKDYASKNALGAKDYADKQLLSFAVEGGNYVGRNKITGAIVSSSPISLTAEQNLYAPTDLEDKQARYKTLAKQTADQAALIARTSGLGLPGTVEMLTEQQKSRTAEQDVLRGEIGVLQKQGQSAKHASAEFLQVSARLEQLRAAGQENGPEGKALQARIAKETYIPPVSSELSEEQLDALYGPNGSVTQGRLDPYKVNGRTAKVYANAEITNPGTNFNQLGGAAALNRNAPFMAKQYAIEMLPQMLANLGEAGKKLNFSDNKYFGELQAWYKGASNDPDFRIYMAQRMDTLLTLTGAMRAVGMSDLAQKAEDEAAPKMMSPRAFDAYVAGQYKALEPRLNLSRKFTGTKPPAETPNAPAKTVTGQTVKNW